MKKFYFVIATALVSAAALIVLFGNRNVSQAETADIAAKPEYKQPAVFKGDR